MKTTSLLVNCVAVLALSALLVGCGNSGGGAAGGGVGAVAAQAPSVAAPASSASAPADNGVSKLTAEQIFTRSKAVLKAAPSFRAVGAATSSGQKIKFDIEARGKDGLGKLTIRAAKMELLMVGGKQYMLPSELFWVKLAGMKTSDAEKLANLVGNRWVIITAKNKDLRVFFDMINVDAMLELDGKPAKGTTTQIAGQPAIQLKDAGGGVLSVATTGQPYPIELHDSDGVLTFSDFGEAFTDLKKPAESQVVDLNL